MPLESANFVSDLVSSNPSSTDGMAQGDDHIRLLKSALKATFPDLVGAFDSTFLVPSGGIIDWSGSIANIPTGWALCDGANGTPDLRDRFVVGAGSTYAVGATGGAATIALTLAQLAPHSHTGSTSSDGSHNHTGSTNTTGNHTHGLQELGTDKSGGNVLRIRGGGSDEQTAAAGNHSHSLNINSAGSHNHSLNINSTGSGEAHENRPPYYALAKIMKL